MNLSKSHRGLVPAGLGLICALAIAATWLRTANGQAAAAPCMSAKFHGFDFFLGEWEVYDVGASKLKAHNSVTRMLDGCAIREVYSRIDGYVGESFSTYDSSRARWHQSWVTNRGELLLLDGGLKDGNMVLTAIEHAATGIAPLTRGVWRPARNGVVRETAERSIDGGKTWTPVFDIEFRPRAR